jgi:hypothetical protein
MSGYDSSPASTGVRSQKALGTRPKCGIPHGFLAAMYATVGAFVAVLCYWAMVLVMEIGVMPSLRAPGALVVSYGAALVLVVTPLIGAQGASLAIALYLTRTRKRLAAIAVCVGSSVAGLALVGSLWLDDVNRYGMEASAIVLYVPGALFSLFLFLVAIVEIGILIHHRKYEKKG